MQLEGYMSRGRHTVILEQQGAVKELFPFTYDHGKANYRNK